MSSKNILIALGLAALLAIALIWFTITNTSCAHVADIPSTTTTISTSTTLTPGSSTTTTTSGQTTTTTQATTSTSTSTTTTTTVISFASPETVVASVYPYYMDEGSCHIIYETVGNVHHIYYSEGSWKFELIESVTCAGLTNQPSIFQLGEITYASYFDFDNTRPRVATRTNGSWAVTTPTGASGGKYSSVVADASGNVYLAYINSNDLIYAKYTKQTNTWGLTTVDTQAADNPMVIVLDSQDQPNIVYLQFSTDYVRYASFNNSNNTWQLNTVDSSDSFHDCDVDLDSQDQAHILYFDSTNALQLAKGSGSTWSKEEIKSADNYGNHLGISVDQSDNNADHIIYTGGSVKNVFDLDYITNRSGSWQTYTLINDQNVSGNSYVPIKVDVDHKVHILYYDFTAGTLCYFKQQ